MKRDALTHPKMLDLASTLAIPRAQAIGIMNLLWDQCATFAPRGDLGKLRNGAIARGCDWQGDADEFIQALLDTGWLEAHDSHRLIVHDWPDHCEQWVRLKLTRLKMTFLECYRTAEGSATATAEASAESSADASASRDPNPNPNLAQTKPSQANPKPTPNPNHGDAVDWSVRWSVGVVEKSFFDRVVESANRFARLKTKVDRELVWQVCWIGCEFDRESIDDACDKLKQPGEVAKPENYLKAIVRKLCESNGESWDRLRKLVPPAPPPPPMKVSVVEESLA